MPKEQQELLINEYYSNDAKLLRNLIDSKLLKFGGIYDKDKEDFYSLGNEVFLSALNTFDPSKAQFKTYLSNCLDNKIKTEITKRNASKRKADIVSISVGEDDDESFLDLVDETDYEESALQDEIIREYMNNFSFMGKKIVEMRLQGKTDIEIMKTLNIDRRKFVDEVDKLKKIALKQVETKHTVVKKVEEKETKQMISISPDYRDDHLSIDAIKQKIDHGELLINHPNQRNDWRWNKDDISTLVTTALHGFRINPIIVCEENIGNGTILNWIVDGKQRVTSLIHFMYPQDGEKYIRISKNTEYTEIPYQVNSRDENGNVITDDLGRPVMEIKVFDIKGKRFIDFPKELQFRLQNYYIDATRYVNCDRDMISYHIRRYNKGKAMTKIEKANTYFKDTTAALCKKVSKHPFFYRLPAFKLTDINNGTTERVVMDSIMIMHYRENWNSSPINTVTFIEGNGQASDFDEIEHYLTRLNDIIDDDTATLFTKENAFIFISLFYYFDEFDFSDEEFNDFLREFKNSYGDEVIDGNSFNSYCDNREVSTKAKSYVLWKVNRVERLLEDKLTNRAA